MKTLTKATVICDHENVPLTPCEFEALHDLLTAIGRPPRAPHFAARAGWNWKKLRTLGKELRQREYFLLSCPPEKNAADRVLRGAFKLIPDQPGCFVLVGQDRFFAPIARELRAEGSEVLVVAKNRRAISRKLASQCDGVLTTRNLRALAPLPGTLVMPAEALLDSLYELGGTQQDGTSGWVALDQLNEAMRSQPALACPQAAGYRTVLRLARACQQFAIIEQQFADKNSWLLRGTTHN
jgi:hypothetical protein